jgi:hypothetical protein
MSTLLEQASLVMIPSGYKEDIVYSQIPTNGNGDLSFTRASNGTRINSAGLVEVTPWNLLEQSNTFNTTWVSAGPGATITSGQTDPNSGSNAWLLSKLGATGRIQQTVNVGGVQTFFIFAKKNTSDYILINVFDGTTSHECWFNLSTGVVGTQNSSTGTIESFGNGWFKCSVTSTNLVASGIIQIYQSDGNGNVTGASGSIFIFNSQLNIGSTAKPYFPTTDRLNVPRLTYQNGGGGCPSLLLEKQSTNLLSYSEQFDNAAWAKGSASGGTAPVVTANYGISPDGTQNADRIQLERTTSTNSYSEVYQPATVTSGQTYTFSVWLKSLSGTPTIGFASQGTAVTTYTATLTNDWVRYTYTATALSTSIFADLILWQSVGATSLSADFLAWGFQVEQSSYETSYIPTTSASATRVADACFKTGISSLIGQTEGTMFVEVDLTHTNGSGTNQYLMQLYKEPGVRILLYRDNASEALSFYFIQGLTVFNYTSSVSSNARHKLAFAYKSGSSAFYIDGAQIDTNATTFSAFSSLFELQMGANFNPTQAEIGDYNYNQAVVFKTRLTNAELASLTTL